MKAASAVVFAVIIAGVALIVWWRVSPGSPDVDAVIATVSPGDDVGAVVEALGIGDCWRKRPDTGEMVCHYAGSQRTYAVRFRAGNVTEILHDRRLGGADLPPFNHPLDLVLAPER